MVEIRQWSKIGCVGDISVYMKACCQQGWDKYCPAIKFHWKMHARKILEKSLQWQILAFLNKIKLKICEIENLLLLRYTGDDYVIIIVKCHEFCMAV